MSQITCDRPQNVTCPPWCTASHRSDEPNTTHHFAAGREFPTSVDGEQDYDIKVYASTYINADGVTSLVSLLRDAADCLDLSPNRAREIGQALIEAANQIDPAGRQ